MDEQGWLGEVFEEVENEVKSWPAWMRKQAGLEEAEETAADAYQRGTRTARAGGT